MEILLRPCPLSMGKTRAVRISLDYTRHLKDTIHWICMSAHAQLKLACKLALAMEDREAGKGILAKDPVK